MPRVEARLTEGLTAIEGRPPDLALKPAGCAFHPRCAQRRNICSVEQPPSIVTGPGREARCWLAAEGQGLIDPEPPANTELQEEITMDTEPRQSTATILLDAAAPMLEPRRLGCRRSTLCRRH